MTALAVFTCRANSHPFQERQVGLNEPVKIGRSVARARPAQTNAIFDCKVLSRNHALIWYDNGKFFLQDTKSSNGTFINNQRLSKGSEESQPRELFSGDIVQFGVDVLENARRVTHSCIIASVQLYHADGREAANNHSSPLLNSPATGATLQSQEIYQLAQCLQEALHRETMLENKLATLQRLVDNTQSATESGWQALINEDRLLSRLEILENQLQAYSKNQTEESLQQKIVELHEDKDIYESKSKEALRKVLDEKLEAVQKLTDLERSLSTTEDECAHVREMCEASQAELADLAKKHQDAVAEVNALTLKLQEAEKEHATDLERVEKEKLELEERIEEMSKEEEGLHAKVEALEAAADFSRIQLANMEQKLEEKVASSPNSVHPQLTESQGVQVELVNLLDLQLLQSKNDAGDGSSDTSTTDEEDNKAKEELLAKENHENEIEKEAEDDDSISEAELRATLSNLEDMATLELSNNIDDDLSTSENTLIRPPEKLKASQKQLEQYKAQLEESEKKLKDSQDKVQLLQKELDEARMEVNKHLSSISSLEERLQQSDGQLSEMVEKAVGELKLQLQESQKQCSNTELLNEKLSEKIESLEVELNGLKSKVSSEEIIPTFSEVQGSSISGTALKEEVESLKDLLEEVEKSRKQFEDENTAHKCELSKTHEELRMSSTELSELKEQLEASRLLTSEKATMVAQLTERLQEIESNQVDVKTQLANLQDEKTKAVTEARQAKLQIDNLKATVSELESELHLSNRYGNEADTDASKAHQEMQKHQASNKAEFANLKQECSNLKKRIQDIETEMKMSRIENNQLQTDYTKLEQSYRELEELKETLEDKEQKWKLNMTDAQKSANATKSELLHANDEIAQLKMEVLGYKDEISQLKDEFTMMNEEYDNLSYKCKTVSTCSMIPLLLLLLGILIAFYPVLSVFTVTSQPDFPQTQSRKNTDL